MPPDSVTSYMLRSGLQSHQARHKSHLFSALCRWCSNRPSAHRGQQDWGQSPEFWPEIKYSMSRSCLTRLRRRFRILISIEIFQLSKPAIFLGHQDSISYLSWLVNEFMMAHGFLSNRLILVSQCKPDTTIAPNDNRRHPVS